MRGGLSSAYHTVENRAQALVTRHYLLLHERYAAQHPRCVRRYQNYRSFRRDTSKPALSAFSVVSKSRISGKLGREIVSRIAYQGYTFNFPNSAAFPPIHSLLIKISSLNQPTLQGPVRRISVNALAIVGMLLALIGADNRAHSSRLTRSLSAFLC
jgi:hypothetical protein